MYTTLWKHAVQKQEQKNELDFSKKNMHGLEMLQCIFSIKLL